jgi:hypothetical protein
MASELTDAADSTGAAVGLAPPLLAGRVVAWASVAFAALLVGGDVAAWAGLEPDGSGQPLAPDLLELWSLAAFGAAVTAYGATCFWLARSRYFAQVHAPEFPHVRGGTAVWLGWLLPVVDWLFPYQVVRDVRIATSRGRRAGGLLVLWWLPWLVFTLATDWGWTSGRMSDPPTAYYVMRSTGLCLALGPWLVVVRQLGADQRELARVPPLP